jgi:hypothetical protein
MNDERDTSTRASNVRAGDRIDGARRRLLSALAAVPPLALLGGCSAFDPTRPSGGGAPGPSPLSVSEAERTRRRNLTAAHVAEENQHDIDGLMNTFSEHAEVSVQGVATQDRELIRQGHVEGGFSNTPGSLENLRVEPKIEYITDDEIVFEGRLVGTHVRPMNGFPPTNREVAIPYIAFYRFDADGKLVSERLTFNWGVLSPTPPEWPFD